MFGQELSFVPQEFADVGQGIVVRVSGVADVGQGIVVRVSGIAE